MTIYLTKTVGNTIVSHCIPLHPIVLQSEIPAQRIQRHTMVYIQAI